MWKYDIVNALIRAKRYRRYLEICTPLTGMTFYKIDKTSLGVCHRLMYRCPPYFNDGSEITFRSVDTRIDGLLPADAVYDIVFIDSWHTYECTLRDLQEGFSRLAPRGRIVVHDCFPVRREETSNLPPRPWRSWNGMSYCAYVDFIWSARDRFSYMVDSDQGCGVIKKLPHDTTRPKNRNHELIPQWFRMRSEKGYDVFDFFAEHRNDLVDLVSAEEFLSLEGIDRRWLVPSASYLLQRAVAELREALAIRPHRLRIQPRLAREGWLS